MSDVESDAIELESPDVEEGDTYEPDDYLTPMMKDVALEQFEETYQKYLQGDWEQSLLEARRSATALQALSAHTKLLPVEYATDFCEVLCSQFGKDIPQGEFLVSDADPDLLLAIVAIYGLGKLLEDHGLRSGMERTLLKSWKDIALWLLFFDKNFGVQSKKYNGFLAASTAKLLAQASKPEKIKALICFNVDLLDLIIKYWDEAHRCHVDDEGDVSRALANCGSLSNSVRAVMMGLIMQRNSGIPMAVVVKFTERVVQTIRWTENWKALDGYARALNFFKPIPPETSDYIQMEFTVDNDACDMIERMRDNLPAIFPSPEDNDYPFACSAISGIISFYAFALEQTYGADLARRLLYIGFLSNLFVFSPMLNEGPAMASLRDVVPRTLTRTFPRLLGQYSLLPWFKDAYFESYSKEGRDKLDRTSTAREWDLLEGFLFERLAYKALFDDNEDGGGTLVHCANPDCQKIDEGNVFQVCSACRSVRYCSKACQTTAWKHKGHKEECKKKDPEEQKNNDFVLYCIRRDVIRHLPGIRNIAEKRLQNTDFSLVGVGIDYTRLPTRFEVFRLKTLLSQVSGHEPDVVKRLNVQLKRVKEGKKNELFVRAVWPLGSGKTRTEYVEVSLKSVDAFAISEGGEQAPDRRVKRPVGFCGLHEAFKVVPFDKADKYMMERLEPELMKRQ